MILSSRFFKSFIVKRKKEEGRRKKEGGRRQKAEGRREEKIRRDKVFITNYPDII
ncbi:hypothetical protein [Okeania sp. KiyG1]|uniref:hypothetical protein n=1 Tax=Okeania sp. KiyG1 TaxID=2720165 RepID=UPI001920CFB8|nr:hypothetical protein [Okeania sp. KiyG1]